MRLGLLTYRRLSRHKPIYQHSRVIAAHKFSHYASALSVLPTRVDTSAVEFKDNAARFGELMARMRKLHETIERGGPQKAREKHIARGKMLPREYVAAS